VEAAEGVDALVVNRADFSSVFTEQLYPNLQKYFKEVAALKQVSCAVPLHNQWGAHLRLRWWIP
jgi:hypothetical protein